MQWFDPASQDFDPQRGCNELEARAARGDAEACERLSVLAGAGIAQPQDWAQAISWLARAAALGLPTAAEQWALISAGPMADDALSNAQLDMTPDISAWLQLPPKLSHGEAPRIRSYERFVGTQVCDWLMARATRRLKPARVYDAHSGDGVLDMTRTNSEADFDLADTDLVLLLLRARIAAAAGVPAAVLEPGKVLHYSPGQQFEPHFDFISPATPALRRELQQRGQRIATLLIALNEGYSGGATEFPQLGWSWRGRRGGALLFGNTTREGVPEPQSLHAGRPPAGQDKWLYSQWIRDRTPQPV